MAVKKFEQPRGSDEWWVSITHPGDRWKKKFGDKQLAREVAARAEVAVANGDNTLPPRAVVDALLDYHTLPTHERRRRNFRLIPGGRTD